MSRRGGMGCASLNLCWPQPKAKGGAGRPSFQKLYEAELYKCLRNCEWEVLEKIQSSQVPPWWRPGKSLDGCEVVAVEEGWQCWKKTLTLTAQQ
eukprot:6467175-Amphidinium_carterae.3